MQPIIPVVRQEPFDDTAYLFELKLDGFRGLADTIQGRMLSKNGNRLKRFETLLGALPPGYVFDGEIVALDGDGHPMFNDLLFGRRDPVYVAFDVLVVDGDDVRALALKERRAMLTGVVRRYRLQKTEPVLGDGRAAFRAVCGLDLEGIVAKRLTDSYGPRTKWWKILNRDYSQKDGAGGTVRAAARLKTPHENRVSASLDWNADLTVAQWQ
jgi:bifunctional non-homologous end joining protein LigD